MTYNLRLVKEKPPQPKAPEPAEVQEEEEVAQVMEEEEEEPEVLPIPQDPLLGEFNPHDLPPPPEGGDPLSLLSESLLSEPIPPELLPQTSTLSWSVVLNQLPLAGKLYAKHVW